MICTGYVRRCVINTFPAESFNSFKYFSLRSISKNLRAFPWIVWINGAAPSNNFPQWKQPVSLLIASCFYNSKLDCCKICSKREKKVHKINIRQKSPFFTFKDGFLSMISSFFASSFAFSSVVFWG